MGLARERTPELVVSAFLELPEPLARCMLWALSSGEYEIVAAAYEMESARCPVAAAIDFAERRGLGGGDWWPGGGSIGECEGRVRTFVHAFRDCAFAIGVDAATELVLLSLRDRYRRVVVEGATG
jgi:hypothetical protein